MRNHFVPAHEHLWWNVPMLAHAAAEWTMDRHVAQQLFRPPAMLLQADDWLEEYMAARFDCIPAASRRAIRQLAGTEAMLRHSRLPSMLHGMGRLLDRKLAARFDYYIWKSPAGCRRSIAYSTEKRQPGWPIARRWRGALAHRRARAGTGGVPLAAPGNLFELEAPVVLQQAA